MRLRQQASSFQICSLFCEYWLAHCMPAATVCTRRMAKTYLMFLVQRNFMTLCATQILLHTSCKNQIHTSPALLWIPSVANGKRDPSSVRKNHPLLNYCIRHKSQPSQPYVNNFQGKIISKKCKYL